MTYELATISVDDLNSVTGAGGYFDALMMQRQQHPQKPTSASRASAPTGPSELGNICRDLYTGTGAAIGAAATSETAGWGGIPGTVVGGMLGRALCPP